MENEFIKILMNVSPFDATVAGARDRCESTSKIQSFQSRMESWNKGEKFNAVKACMGKEDGTLLEMVPMMIDFMEDFNILLRDIPGRSQDRPQELLDALKASFNEALVLMSPVFEKSDEQLAIVVDLHCEMLKDTATTGPDIEKWQATRQENSVSSTMMGLRKCIDILIAGCQTVNLEQPDMLKHFLKQILAAVAWMDLVTAVEDLCVNDKLDLADQQELSQLVGTACSKLHAFERVWQKEKQSTVAPLVCTIVV